MVRYGPVWLLPVIAPRRLILIRTLGAAVGALLVLLFLVTVASKLATPPEKQQPVTQAAALRR